VVNRLSENRAGKFTRLSVDMTGSILTTAVLNPRHQPEIGIRRAGDGVRGGGVQEQRVALTHLGGGGDRVLGAGAVQVGAKCPPPSLEKASFVKRCCAIVTFQDTDRDPVGTVNQATITAIARQSG